MQGIGLFMFTHVLGPLSGGAVIAGTRDEESKGGSCSGLRGFEKRDLAVMLRTLYGMQRGGCWRAGS